MGQDGLSGAFKAGEPGKSGNLRLLAQALAEVLALVLAQALAGVPAEAEALGQALKAASGETVAETDK